MSDLRDLARDLTAAAAQAPQMATTALGNVAGAIETRLVSPTNSVSVELGAGTATVGGVDSSGIAGAGSPLLVGTDTKETAGDLGSQLLDGGVALVMGRHA